MSAFSSPSITQITLNVNGNSKSVCEWMWMPFDLVLWFSSIFFLYFVFCFINTSVLFRSFNWHIVKQEIFKVINYVCQCLYLHTHTHTHEDTQSHTRRHSWLGTCTATAVQWGVYLMWNYFRLWRRTHSETYSPLTTQRHQTMTDNKRRTKSQAYELYILQIVAHMDRDPFTYATIPRDIHQACQVERLKLLLKIDDYS